MMKKQSILLIGFLVISMIRTIYAQDIFDAVKNNNLEKVKQLVEDRTSILAITDDYGRTPLHWAARGVYYEIMDYLIIKGADVNSADNNHITPIMSVTTRKHLEALNLLLNNGVDIDKRSNEGDQPIHYAAYYGFKEAVKIFLDKGASIESKNNYGRTPLLVATRESGDLETVKFLIEKGANINAIDAFGDSPISLSAWRGFSDVVEYLIDNNAKIYITGKEGTNLLKYATTKGLEKLYFTIVDKGGDIFSLSLKNQSALHWAATGNSEKIVRDLIEKGMKVNSKDAYNWSPLHYAAYFGRLSVAQLLIEKGADIEITTPLQETPFQLAQTQGKKEVMEFLLSKGADASFSGTTKITGKYFGQKKPDTEPQLFAPGIVSRLKGGHSNITFSPDGSEAFWTEWNLTESGYTNGCKLWYSKIEKGEWIKPEMILNRGDTPIFSVDGKKIFFLILPHAYNENPERGIWYLEKKMDEWSNPNYLDFNIATTGLYWQFSFDKDNNLYYSNSEGLKRSLYKNGKYNSPENLAEIFQEDYKGGAPFISPDGSFIIFSSMDIPGSYGGLDLYIGFKKKDGSWTNPINMGPQINTSQNEHLPMVSGDGEYLFFRTERENIDGIYWVSTKIIKNLKSNEL